MQTTKILPLLLVCWLLSLTTAAQAQWWLQEDKLIALDGTDSDEFGHSVSIDGDYAIVGVYKDDDNGSDSGSAYIFKRNGITWTQQAKLIASDGEENDHFGQSVSISGDYAVIGADLDNDEGINSGAAYIFKRSGESWTQKAKLTVFDNDGLDRFGWSVSIDGDYAVIGTQQAGAAYVFYRLADSSWIGVTKLLASDGITSDQFGWAVSISGDFAIIGAHSDDDNGSMSGSAYTFEKSVMHPAIDMSGDCFVNFMDLAVMADLWLTGVE